MVKVLCPTRQKIGHFGDISQANLLAWYGKTKPNTTKVHIYQSKQMYYNTKINTQELKPGLVASYVVRPSVLWRCWLGGRKGIRPVKIWGDGGGGHWLVQMEWHLAGCLVCLPLLIFPCIIKSRSSLLALAHPGGTGKRTIKRLWCRGGYVIWPGNGEGLFLFWHFINLPLTYLGT